MHNNLSISLVYVLNDEGGFAIRASEPGGACNKGISLAKLIEWNAKKGLPEPSIADLKALTDDQAKEIYTEDFWGVVHADDLPSGVDYCIMDAAVNEGPTGAIKFLQEAMNITITGKPDEATIAQANNCNGEYLIQYFCELRLDAKKNRVEWNDHIDPVSGELIHGFGPGWTARINRVIKRSFDLLPHSGQLSLPFVE